MRLKFTATALIGGFRDGQLNLTDGEIAEVPDEYGQTLLKELPSNFTPAEPIARAIDVPPKDRMIRGLGAGVKVK